MKQKINKSVFATISVLLVITMFFVNVYADVEPDAKIKIDITEVSDGQYEVAIEDDPYYEEHKPTIYVNTGYSTNYVYIKNTTTIVESNSEGGKVSFTVEAGGTYCISKTRPSFFPEEPQTNKYKFPKTGIE